MKKENSTLHPDSAVSVTAMAATSAIKLLTVLVVAAVAGIGQSQAAVHKVGNALGWTILGSPNYTDWAITKNFHVGDTILFEYNKNFHNVLEVSKEDYKACDASRPLAAYTSGNDSVVLKRRGHHFFICGVPGHCSTGQKVDIRIAKLAAPAPGAALSPVSPAAPTPFPAAAAGGGGSVVVSTPAAAPQRSGGAATGIAAAPLLALVALSAVVVAIA